MVAFKEPLTKEEEEKYIKLFMSGNEEAKQILIEHNLRLVAHIIKKYSGCDKDINDMMPAYKSIRGVVITETPLIKTTTNKIKRQEELKTIE